MNDYLPTYLNTLKNIYMNPNNSQNINQTINVRSNYYNQKEFIDNLKNGKFLNGIMHIEKGGNIGYVYVKELNNNIVIFGKNDLNKTLNLDEVLIELYPINKWKPIITKLNNDNKINENLSTNSPIFNIETNEEEKQNTNLLDQINFKTKKEKFKYINDFLYYLIPFGKVINIVKSPNRLKSQICRILIENDLVYGVTLDGNIPNSLSICCFEVFNT